MKKVLVTGSLGYVGSVLTEYLEKQGYGVVGYDTGFFKDCILSAPPQTETIIKDARDFEKNDLKGIDAVVHLAGVSNDPVGNVDASKIYDPTRAYAKNIAQLCKEQGIQFIFASSCSVYGRGSEVLNEDSSTQPQTPYSLNKLQVEEDLGVLADKDFSPIALRFATAFGYSPRMRFDIVVNMFTGMATSKGVIVLNSDGTAWRPNVHILDMCKAIIYALNSTYRGGDLLVLNVGDERENRQIIDLAKTVSSLVPNSHIEFLNKNPNLDTAGLIRDRKVKEVDTRTYSVSFARIRETFPGFVCDWNLEKGTLDMIERFKAVGLTKDMFESKNFYRLQKIESLYNEGKISENLRWIVQQP
jgi:nucleoside-diphosphate-sugar epimerase